MVGAEGTKNFYFDNPRSLEKALSGTELHRKLLRLTKVLKVLKLLLKNVEEILGRIFSGSPYRSNGIKTRGFAGAFSFGTHLFRTDGCL